MTGGHPPQRPSGVVGRDPAGRGADIGIPGRAVWARVEAELLPDTAELVTDAGTETVPHSALVVGDVVLVRPGGRVPVDGVVAEGSADVDASMITGESRAVPKEPGAKVVAGTVAAGGSLRVTVTAVGEGTALSGIMRMVAAAQASASRTQALADRAAAILFYVALSSGLITFGFWWLDGDQAGALTRMATVLLIACPHALGLAIPLVIAISTSLGRGTACLSRTGSPSSGRASSTWSSREAGLTRRPPETRQPCHRVAHCIAWNYVPSGSWS